MCECMVVYVCVYVYVYVFVYVYVYVYGCGGGIPVEWDKGEVHDMKHRDIWSIWSNNLIGWLLICDVFYVFRSANPVFGVESKSARI
jgi:hypothetical protein